MNNGFGIYAQTDNDRGSIENMAFNNVGVAIRLKGADAARISGSWIAETAFGIELTGASRATATDSCPPASATTWPMTIGPTCTRYGREAAASWPPMQEHDNGLDDDYGLVHVEGTRNTVVANHVSEVIDPEHLRPAGARPVVVRVADGSGNYIAANHVVAMTESAAIGDDAADSCFGAQVDAMLANECAVPLDMVAVKVDPSSTGNVVLDTATDAQADLDRSVNAFRPIPAISA